MVRNSRAGSTPKGGSSMKPRAQTNKANAAGYAKRHSRKSTLLSGPVDNVYEYKQEGKQRRAKVTQELDRDEAKEFGVHSGEEEEEDAQMDGRQARLIGENVDDEMIDSADDEEIDSEDAFEESDNDRFAGFAFKNKNRKRVKRRPVKLPDVDLNEDSDEHSDQEQQPDDDASVDPAEEEESGQDDEFFDVLDVLDGRGKLDDDSEQEIPPTKKQPSTSITHDSGDEDEMDSESESDSEEDSQIVIDASDDDDEGPTEKLTQFISSLDTASRKRKPTEAELEDEHETAPDPQRRKRRMIKERTESGIENEFRAHSSSGSKLRLDDLLAPLSQSSNSNLASLQKSTKALAATSSAKSGSKAKVLSAPLAQRTQERLDREAAYGQTKEEVDKWSATMKRIKEAEHLSFPLQAAPTTRVSNLELAAKFKPTTELETSISNLLASAQLADANAIATTESLEMTHLSLAEVASRRADLRKMRELMFRAEVKAKRVAKIKSKTYRRIQKKARNKLDAAAGTADDDGDERMQMERDRAMERATLRHKNTGKWAKQLKRKGAMDGGERKEMLEMLDRGEKLRRRIQGVGSDDDDDEDEGEFEDGSHDEDDEGEDGMMRIKQSAFDEIARLTDAQSGSGGVDAKSGKGIFEIKFMKDAMARQQQRADQSADDFVKEMGGRVGGSDDEEEGAPIDEETSGVAVQRVGGRLIYRPGTLPAKGISIDSHVSDTSSVTLKSTDVPSPLNSVSSLPPTNLTTSISPPLPPPATTNVNPWLVASNAAGASKAPRKKNEILVSKDSDALEKGTHKLNKKAKKREEEEAKKGGVVDDAAVEISMDNVLSLQPLEQDVTTTTTTAVTAKKAKKPKHKKKQVAGANTGISKDADGDDDDDANSELEEQERIDAIKGKGKAKGPRAFEQRDLVALAFAGDNVVQDFEDTKRREMAADAPREVDTTLAGWGSWGGTGTRKLPSRPHLIKKVPGIAPAARADHGKAHVIISEKRDKKAEKYQVKDLPYPYTSQAQYERSMERPVGAEWNTRVGFQRGTMPKVVKKMGVVINPLEKLF